MGRYYSGDIDGKFWFAVQSSSAADRFGVTGEPPSTLCYYFDESNLDDINAEIEKIEKKLGFKKIVIEKIMADTGGWNDFILAENHITKAELEDYADLELGKKIRDCVVEQGSCGFDAEC
jgi:hypothetical protein